MSRRRLGEPHRVLLVEDQFFLAELMREEIERLGYRVVGPTGSVAEALTLLSGGVSAGLLDINLGTELVTPVAEELVRRETPFGFLTAYTDAKMLPARFSHYPFFKKPLSGEELAAALDTLLSDDGD